MDFEILLISFIGMLQTVSSLKCYVCSSLLDPKCGLMWEFKDNEADKYLLECNKTETSCNKIVGELQGNGDQHVYRKCWLRATLEKYTPTDCHEIYVTGAQVCHCQQDGCNGSDVIKTSWSRVFGIVIFTVTVRNIGLLFNVD